MVPQFEISYDEHGEPYHVTTWDGFAHCSRPFDKKEDGWMLEQLSYHDFPAIMAGRQMKALVDEVNYLRRENYRLRKSEEMWMGAAGFGPKKGDKQ